MSWDEAFAERYEEWSAHMTADIAFYTALAVQAGGTGLSRSMLIFSERRLRS
jgi:hypothetical protein